VTTKEILLKNTLNILLIKLPVWFLFIFVGWCFGDKIGMGIAGSFLLICQLLF